VRIIVASGMSRATAVGSGIFIVVSWLRRFWDTACLAKKRSLWSALEPVELVSRQLAGRPLTFEMNVDSGVLLGKGLNVRMLWRDGATVEEVKRISLRTVLWHAVSVNQSRRSHAAMCDASVMSEAGDAVVGEATTVRTPRPWATAQLVRWSFWRTVPGLVAFAVMTEPELSGETACKFDQLRAASVWYEL